MDATGRKSLTLLRKAPLALPCKDPQTQLLLTLFKHIFLTTDVGWPVVYLEMCHVIIVFAYGVWAGLVVFQMFTILFLQHRCSRVQGRFETYKFNLKTPPFISIINKFVNYTKCTFWIQSAFETLQFISLNISNTIIFKILAEKCTLFYFFMFLIFNNCQLNCTSSWSTVCYPINLSSNKQ